MSKFAVIDAEINYDNSIMSIGVVIADSKSMEELDSVYCILTPEYLVGGLFSSKLQFEGQKANIGNRKEVLSLIQKYFENNNINEIYIYNILLEKLLPEFSNYEWYDISKCNADVENILQRFQKEQSYEKTHNAIQDARNELEIMRRIDAILKDINNIPPSELCWNFGICPYGSFCEVCDHQFECSASH